VLEEATPEKNGKSGIFCSAEDFMSEVLTFDKIVLWIKLSRPPFHLVGICPFILGTLTAWKLEGLFSTPVFVLGIIAVILIMLSTYHAGEYFDRMGDAISFKEHQNPFAGGSRVLHATEMSAKVPLWTSVISILAAAGIGIYLQYGLGTGPYTIFLGALGLFPGFFYSTKPIRLVEKGIGEIFIGFCYGWLPIASAYYIQTGRLAPVIHWMGIAVGFTIFNVILLNEFPDYHADKTSGKRNLLVRLGVERGALVFSAACVLTWVAVLFSFSMGVSLKALYVFLPVMALSAVIILMVMKKRYENKKTLEVLCGLNIAINIGTTLSYIVAYI
jgi:1,4-dihydroxy-2-naphthoate octaprenyltransferase